MMPSVVLCGSYHRCHDGLVALFRELDATGCRILSPIALDFIDTNEPIVRTPDEAELSIADLQRQHLRAMRSADFIWLHDPGGHIGLSSAYELGFAAALHKPVFCKELPVDEMLATRVQVVQSVSEALRLL
ncbi:MAG TPA: hypothetical protein VLF91_06355 [Candidatus Saccharimonadales bacterium]|nr:hypothetical protein [Candidatus Saccharimonadales bacterium]